MRDDWILDVLADLGEFARANQMEALDLALRRASDVAKVELSVEHVLVVRGVDHGVGSHGARYRDLPERPGP